MCVLQTLHFFPQYLIYAQSDIPSASGASFTTLCLLRVFFSVIGCEPLTRQDGAHYAVNIRKVLEKVACPAYIIICWRKISNFDLNLWVEEIAEIYHLPTYLPKLYPSERERAVPSGFVWHTPTLVRKMGSAGRFRKEKWMHLVYIWAAAGVAFASAFAEFSWLPSHSYAHYA